jgi:REP element-mobilizing transposase RayT
MSFYERNLPHYQRDEKYHFVTFASFERQTLPISARKLVMKSCLHDDRQKYELGAAVVMPDHVHLVLRPLVVANETTALERITQAIKGASAHAINKHTGRRGPVWQDESFDHVIRNGHLYEKIQYVLENPVRKGLVEDWKEYQWVWCAPDVVQMF